MILAVNRYLPAMKLKFGIAFIVISFVSCDFLEKNFSWKDQEEPVYNDGGIRSYYDNGKLKNVCFLDSAKLKHGTCISYYESGTVKNKITYVHGEKIRGISHYKDTGTPALDISYGNGMKNGMRRRYYEDGSVASEFEYKNDHPGKGLVEYNKSGKLIEGYPKLLIKPRDLINTHGKYIVEVYFERNSKRGEYYIGKLYEGKYVFTNPELARLQSDDDGIARYEISVPKGMFRMEKLHFVGKYKTKRGNPYIVEKSFNLAVDNPF